MPKLWSFSNFSQNNCDLKRIFQAFRPEPQLPPQREFLLGKRPGVFPVPLSFSGISAAITSHAQICDLLTQPHPTSTLHSPTCFNVAWRDFSGRVMEAWMVIINADGSTKIGRARAFCPPVSVGTRWPVYWVSGFGLICCG